MRSIIKKFAIFIAFTLKLLLINSKNFWECEYDSNVICQKSQTCCKIITNDPSKNIISTSFKCFEGKNKICCGSKGVCREDEFCNPLLNRCQKFNLTKEPDKNYVMLYQAPKTFKSEKKPKNEFSSESIIEIINLIFGQSENFLMFDEPNTLNQLKNIKFSYLNVPEFIDGFMSGLYIFESAYRNSTCAKRSRILIDDSIEFINLIQHLKFDEHFFDKLHLAVDMLKHLYKDYLKQRKSCIVTCHKLDCIMNKILKRISDKEFPRKLAGHTICYYHELKKKVTDGCDSLKNHDFYHAGFHFGDALRSFAFWDFENTSDCILISELYVDRD